MSNKPADLLLEPTKECGMLEMVIAFTEVRTAIAFLLKEITDLDGWMMCHGLVTFKDRLERFSGWIKSRLNDDEPYEPPPQDATLTPVQLGQINDFLKELMTKATTWNACLDLYRKVDAASDFCFTLSARLQFWEDCDSVAVLFQQSLANLKKPAGN